MLSVIAPETWRLLLSLGAAGVLVVGVVRLRLWRLVARLVRSRG